MSTIVNAQWKSKKVGDIVTFKGEDYEIGSDAFGSLEAAVEAGATSDLVIVDKKLASPVKKENITGAATDIFASTYTEKDTADGKTHTETVKFTGAAGGTASFKDDDATLVGFEKITATEAGGSFAGGKQDISSSLKTVDDSDKNIKTEDMTATATTTATGSLSVTGKTGTPSVETSAIVDSEGNTDKSIAIIKDAYKEITGADREEPLAGTYAAVTLKNANLTADINGGVISEKAVIKTSDTNSEKINKEYTYSASAKVGSGEASLTDANAANISGFKSVKITTSANAVKVGEIHDGNETVDYSKKSAYVADKSFTYNYSAKETDTVSGSLTATGKSGKEIEIDGDIDGFSSVSLKYATVNDDIESSAESVKETTDVSVKDQKGDAAITATFTGETARTADGSLTAADSTLGNLDGVKTVAISNSTIADGAIADATNLKSKTTRKTTGIANAGITDNIDDYITGWTVDADWDKAYTTDFTNKIENSVGGASFKLSGKAPAAYSINVNGYKTVALENGGANMLTANLFNTSFVTDNQIKETFAPESSASYTDKATGTDKAVGDVTAKGMTTIDAVAGFASVKVTGTVDQTVLNGVTGQNTESRTTSISSTIKAGKEDPEGTYTETTSESAKAATALEASKTKFGASFTNLKTAKLQNIKSDVPVVSFAGAVDSDEKTSKKFTWTADDITVLKAAAAGTKSIVDTDVTSWTETSDEKQSASGTFALKNGSETISLSANRFKSVEVSGGANTTLTGAIGQDTYTDKWSESLSVKGDKGTYSWSETESAKAATELTVTKAKLGGAFTNLKTVSLKDVSGAGAASFTATADYDDKYSKKYDWNAEEKAFADVTGINDEAITSWTESQDYKESASGTFALKNGAAAGAISVGAYDFKSIDVAGAIATTTLTGADGQETYTDKWSKSLSVSKGKGTYSESQTVSAKAVTDLTVTKVTLAGGGSDLKTVKLTDVAGTGAFTAYFDYDDKDSTKYEWNAEEKAYKDLTGIYDEAITSWTETNDYKQSASGTFSLKGGSSAVTVSADDFKSVEVAGGSGVLTLNGVTGLDTYTDKDSKSLSVKGGKGTYSYSDTASTKAATDLTASKVTLASGGANLKTVKLTDAAGMGAFNFIATVDADDKYSQKFDWNAEEKAFKDVIGITDEAITSWTESDDNKQSASGTFSLKNGASVDGSVGAYHFKSVEVTGAIDHTFLTGVMGQDTETEKWSKSLSVSKGKGTYSKTSEESDKAATELSASKVTLSGDFSYLKSAALKDAKINGGASFTASLDEDSKSSKKISWNAEDATFADVEGNAFDESVTSWEKTSESKSSVVGTFSLTNSNAAAQIDALSIDNFKNAELSIAVQTAPVAVGSLVNEGDSTSKHSLKRSVSETKRTQDVSSTETNTAVGSLKITGNKTTPTQLVIDDAEPIGYANITLKDAWLSNSAAYATAYAETENYSAKESATLDSGSATAVDLKVSYTHNSKGNGSFTASGSSAFTAFDGALHGYSITLKDKVSIGDVDNYKYDGMGSNYTVPFAEYFDVIAWNDGGIGTLPADAVTLTGNVSGSYKLDAKGQIESKWTASDATTANGSFTQSASVAGVTAGSISGYDKVTLTGVMTVGYIDGANSEHTTELNYKYAKDEEVANSKVEAWISTSASGVSVAGTDKQVATVAGINDYKSVALKNALVSGSVSATNSSQVQTEDKLNSPDTNVEVITDNAVGSLSAVSSELQSNVSGFTTVELKNTVADGVSFAGGSSLTVNAYDADWNFVDNITAITTSTGSFSAVSDEKSADPKLAKVQSVGSVTGFAKVELKNYNAGFINAGASSFEFIAADDEKETPDTWKRGSATSGNTFAASADSYVDGTTIKQNAITVGDVSGYGKVEATGLQEIGAIMNAVIADGVVFGDRVYSSMHYGEFTAVAEEGPLSYTAITSTAGTGVTVKGVSAKGAAPAPTDVLGDVVGYKAIALDTVNLGDGTNPVLFAGGNYTYTTKKGSDDAVVATSTSTADGKLEIKNATFVAGTTFSAEGFKTVDVNIAGTAAFADIVGGTETAQFTDGSFDFTTFKCGDKAVVTTEEGIVTGKVAGYATVTLTDTNFAAGAEIIGFEIGTKKVDDTIEQTYTAKTAVTFDDADEGKAAQTIAGTITNAKSVTFKASTADDETDFDITATILSDYDDDLISDNLTVTFDKCQATVDFSNFALDDGDEIKLTSGTATAQITLGGDYSDLAAYFAGMAGSGFTGTGEIISSAEVDDIKAALDANEISYGAGITFTKA